MPTDSLTIFKLTMKKPTIAVTGQKKGNYKRLADGWGWDNSVVIFDKEEKRRKKPKTF